MPYLITGVRASLDDGRKALIGGELNYQICKLINDFFAARSLTYGTLNEAIGALECAKLEVYRRVAAPYEDRKAMANGEVFTFSKLEA